MRLKAIFYGVVLILLTTIVSCTGLKTKTEPFQPPAENLEKMTEIYFKNCTPDSGIGIAWVNEGETDYHVFEGFRTYYGEQRTFLVPPGHYIITFYDFQSNKIFDYKEVMAPKEGGKIEFSGGCTPEEMEKNKVRGFGI